jgi:hypothetical protein
MRLFGRPRQAPTLAIKWLFPAFCAPESDHFLSMVVRHGVFWRIACIVLV